MLFWMLSVSEEEYYMGPFAIYDPISDMRYSFTSLIHSIILSVEISPPIHQFVHSLSLGIV